MKTKTSATLAMLSVVTALSLLSPSVLADTSTPLSLGTPPIFNSVVPPGSPSADYGGVITNAGNQHYVIEGGVAAADGWIFSTQVPAGAQVQFKLHASVDGLTTSGSGTLGVSASQNGNSQSDTADVSIKVTGDVAQLFPLSPTPGVEPSQIPLFFTGVATLDNQQGNSQGNNQGISVPISVESAYLNPFGGPIVIASTDSPPSIFLVITYSVATIDWRGVQVDGFLAGTFGATPVVGSFTNVANAQEDLVAGTEQDSGRISFYAFASALDNTPIPQLTANGKYTGSTSFTSAGGVDCSMTVTGIPGTCLFTGATSSGTFSMHLGHGGKISGSYATTWSVPSTFTATTVTAVLTQH